MTSKKKLKAIASVFELVDMKQLTREDFHQIKTAIESIPEDSQEKEGK